MTLSYQRVAITLFIIAIPLAICAQQALATEVTVTIMRVVLEQNSDTGALDAIDRPDTVGIGDIYAKVRIGNAPFESTRSDFREEEDFQPFRDWTFSREVGAVDIAVVEIELWDADTIASNDDVIDINNVDGKLGLVLSLDLNTCKWAGDVTSPASTSRGDGDRDNFGLLDTDQGGEIGNIQFDIACSGTNDFDRDGIPDGVERFGIRDIDGALVVDMVALGADPCRPNIFVEIDFMDGASDGHTHKPSIDALDRVRAAFDGSGPNLVVPLEGCPYPGFPKQLGGGIGLIITIDDALEEKAGTTNSDLPSLRDANFNPLLRPYFHYSLWVHALTESSGIGICCWDKDFIVALREFQNHITGTIPQQSLTFMHELGHALGLHHGGVARLDFDLNGDRVMRNCKPNYLSTMNYLYGHFGIVNDDTGDQILDFSRGELADLREGNLNEIDGIGDGSLVAGWAGPNGELLQGRGDGSLDFDDDGDLLGAEVDLTAMDSIKDCDFASPGDRLLGWNDWENIRFRGAVAPGAAQVSEVIEEQITPEEIRSIQSFWQQYLRCGPPEAGDWVISRDCTIWRDVKAPGSLSILDNVTVRIPKGVKLEIDLKSNALRVAPTARLKVEAGASINAPNIDIP